MAQGVKAIQRARVVRRTASIAGDSKSMAPGGPPTVLVVDDDPSVLNALARLIRAAEFRVLTFDRPTALLAEKIPTANACLILDINLPEMSGVALSQALESAGRGLPTILITGRSDSETARLIANSTAVAVLFKPVDQAPLLEAIAKALKQSTGGKPLH
jgi:FixJ family two-component response regulator